MFSLLAIFSFCAIVVLAILWLQDREALADAREQLKTLRQLDAIAARVEEKISRPVPPGGVRGWVTIPARNGQTIPAAGARAKAFPASDFPGDALGLATETRSQFGDSAQNAGIEPAGQNASQPPVSSPIPEVSLAPPSSSPQLPGDPLGDLIARLPAPAAETVTDADGFFELSGLVSGEYVVVVSCDRVKADPGQQYHWFIRATSGADPSLAVFCSPARASTKSDPGIRWIVPISSHEDGSVRVAR